MYNISLPPVNFERDTAYKRFLNGYVLDSLFSMYLNQNSSLYSLQKNVEAIREVTFESGIQVGT